MLGISKPTIVDYDMFVREVFIHYCAKFSKLKIGGPGKIVEIDEAKIGHRKYNKGRILEGQWIFGGIERNSRKIFLVPVKNRNSKTLLRLIRKHIALGTTLISDCWRGYQNLQHDRNFQHLTVNHSINFVDPETGTHTNTIECVWCEVRSNVPRYGYRRLHFQGYLCEFMFKRIYPNFGDRIHKFYMTASSVYDVYNV